MKAAVVTSFAEPPHYLDFELPAHPEKVDVLAVGLHPRVRTDAAGRHYSSTGALPMIPGVDGVARLADGTRVYFVADDDVPGPMAEQTIIDPKRSIALSDEADANLIAAAMNPAMSSWVALRRRRPMSVGESVLVLGATGNAGTMAVQVAKLLGAGRVVGAGRDPERLQALLALGADDIVPLGDGLKLAAEVDIVIDYLWGEPAEHAMIAILTARQDKSRALDWIQIGAMAGPTMNLPSALLRQANLRILGNGQGAVSTAGYLAELPGLVEQITAGRLGLTVRTVPLADVEAAWRQPVVPGERTVIVPGV